MAKKLKKANQDSDDEDEELGNIYANANANGISSDYEGEHSAAEGDEKPASGGDLNGFDPRMIAPIPKKYDISQWLFSI